MGTYILIIFFGVSLLLFLSKENGIFSSPEKSFNLSYKKKYYFFSIPERKFYEVLKEVANELNYELFSKVRWADILYSDSKGKEWWSNWGKIKSKHVDFLLCERENYTPAVVIELDDSSHLRSDRVRRDNLQDEVLKLAGIKLVRFNISSSYNKNTLIKEIV